MSISIKRLCALCLLPISLAACGSEWEMQRTTSKAPYADERTAGSGVMYVRANMLPEKELKVATDLEKELYAPKTSYKPQRTNEQTVKSSTIISETQQSPMTNQPIVAETKTVPPITSHTIDEARATEAAATSPEAGGSFVDSEKFLAFEQRIKSEIKENAFIPEKAIIMKNTHEAPAISEGQKNLDAIYGK